MGKKKGKGEPEATEGETEMQALSKAELKKLAKEEKKRPTGNGEPEPEPEPEPAAHVNEAQMVVAAAAAEQQAAVAASRRKRASKRQSQPEPEPEPPPPPPPPPPPQPQPQPQPEQQPLPQRHADLAQRQHTAQVAGAPRSILQPVGSAITENILAAAPKPLSAEEEAARVAGIPHNTSPAKERELRDAAQRGLHDKCRELLEAGVAVDGVDASGFTPLISAAGHGHAAALGVLLKYLLSSMCISSWSLSFCLPSCLPPYKLVAAGTARLWFMPTAAGSALYTGQRLRNTRPAASCCSRLLLTARRR